MILPSLPRLAVQPLLSASLKKQYLGFSLGAAAACLLGVPLSPWPQAERLADANTRIDVRIIGPAPKPASTDRIAALLLLEQIGDDIAARGQPDLVALDLGDEPPG